MTSPKRPDESQDAYVIRLVREDEREQCAKIADAIADEPCSQERKVANWCIGRRYGAQQVAAALRKAGME